MYHILSYAHPFVAFTLQKTVPSSRSRVAYTEGMDKKIQNDPNNGGTKVGTTQNENLPLNRKNVSSLGQSEGQASKPEGEFCISLAYYYAKIVG